MNYIFCKWAISWQLLSMGDGYIEIKYAMSCTFCLYLKFSLIKCLKFYCIVLMVVHSGAKKGIVKRRGHGQGFYCFIWVGQHRCLHRAYDLCALGAYVLY